MNAPELLIAGLSGKVEDNRHSSAATFREMGGPVKKKERRCALSWHTFLIIQSENKVKFYLHPLK